MSMSGAFGLLCDMTANDTNYPGLGAEIMSSAGLSGSAGILTGIHGPRQEGALQFRDNMQNSGIAMSLGFGPEVVP
jgi:hypothetical protein